MKNIKISRGLINIILYFVIISCCLLNSAYALNTTHLKIYSKLVLYLTFVLLLILIFLKKEIKITVDGPLKLYLVLMVSFVLSVCFNFSYETVYYAFTIFTTITVAFMITRYIDYNTFILFYIKIMKFLTVTSILAWGLVKLIGVDWLSSITNINGETYYNGFLFFFIESGAGSYSNMSIFWEPGIFASFLLIAMTFETCFKEGKESKINILLFIIGLLSTQSSAGLALLLLYFAIRVSLNKGRLKFIAIIFILGLFSLIFFWGDIFSSWLLNWNYGIFYKFFSIQNATTGTRLYSPLINLKIFQESPLFGQGFYYAERQYVDIMHSTFDVFYVEAQTSTSTLYMAAIGIFGLLYTLAWIIPILINKKLGTIISRILILSLFLLIINKEPHTNIIISYCILFYILGNSNKNYKSRLVEVSHDKQVQNIVSKVI